MKKTVLILGLMLMAGTFSNAIAQRGEKMENAKKLTPAEIAQKRTDKAVKDLGLDENQTEKLYAINLKQANENLALKKEMKALKAKFEANKTQHEADINDLLTKEQLEKKLALEAERKAKKGDKKNDANRPPHPPRP
ncbi:hypothetical protein DNU06_00295 [Putridiphycobacter roseus]|uniref:DUF4890 domain-containing protein n=1 Tax=Putridiphycobacter roseus TaxID=2219161 RepID=A0A2W1N124_9FLAO|nr:hypothetical protein [Putridiphycobacter roseus]PZE18309.1 hypothetical protein DNU06_00295 [Putridiphycobacter roseus]